MTVFTGTTHVDTLDAYYGLVSAMLLDPGFRDEDFKRVRDDTLNYIKVSLRENNEEEAGQGATVHRDLRRPSLRPPDGGDARAIEKLTIDDVKAFYRQNYTRANLVLAISGGYGDAFLDRVRNDMQKLPEGPVAKIALPRRSRSKDAA